MSVSPGGSVAEGAPSGLTGYTILTADDLATATELAGGVSRPSRRAARWTSTSASTWRCSSLIRRGSSQEPAAGLATRFASVYLATVSNPSRPYEASAADCRPAR